MEHRHLGSTGLTVSAISIGTEHLVHQSAGSVTALIRESIARGVNYFDVVYSFPEYLDTLGEALDGYRDRVLLTGHLGSTVRNGQYCRSLSAKASEPFFRDLLARLRTDHVDLLFLHNYNSPRDWDTASRPNGIFETALRLQQEGRARFLGISGHYMEVVRRACHTGRIDAVMFPVNLLGHATPARRELLDLCVEQGLGLVAMKPYGGGRLLHATGTQRVAAYQTGGDAYRVRFPSAISPSQCIGYTLSQGGVSTALVGVRSMTELDVALRALESTEAERDFSGLLAAFGRAVEGECVYCNHCLPCPVAIDIAEVNRLLDLWQAAPVPELSAQYARLPAKGSACTRCGACVQRCPFGVAVISRMEAAQAAFER